MISPAWKEMQYIKASQFKPLLLSACSLATGLSIYSFFRNEKNELKIFNRDVEVESLVHQVTKNYPGHFLVTGPPDSGKTSVLKKVMEKSKDSCQWFHMDMRQPGSSWDDIPSMYISMYRAFVLSNNNSTSIRAFEMTADILKLFTFKVKIWLNKTNEVDEMKKLLLTVEKKMIRKKRSLLHPQRSYKPVLFLDEANHMYRKLDKTERERTF